MQIVGRIPFDQVFTKAMIQGKSVLEYAPESEAAIALLDVWRRIENSPSMNAMGIHDFSAVIQ
jgi:nitrogenase subunit NifH